MAGMQESFESVALAFSVVQILRSGIDEALLALGRASVHDLRA